MSVINAIPLLLGDEGYNISRSVRLRSSASAYFNRTPASAGNRRTWTWSGWVKRGALGANHALFSTTGSSTDSTFFWLGFNSSDKFAVSIATQFLRVSTAVYRDPSAWYHVVVAFDTTQANAADRVKLFLNGVQITAFDTSNAPTQNADYGINLNQAHFISTNNNNYYFDGYLTEVNFIDGQALTPSSFGETDAITGVWKPKKYAGTYGTNGFYLNFSDNSSNTATTIGKDNSGNGNNWTPNNISVTSGVTYDSMIDVPTLYADGGNGRGNYAVLNPLDVRFGVSSANTLASGNLQATAPSGAQGVSQSSILFASGKWYMEMTLSSVSSVPSAQYIAYRDGSGNAALYAANGSVSGVSGSSGATYTTNDVIGMAVDKDAGTIEFFKNGTTQGGSRTLTSNTAGDSYFQVSNYNSSVVHANFGQRPFAYTPPTGFKALNTQNLPAPTILKGNQYFDVRTRAGTSTATTISGYAFAPDLVWIKIRNGAERHVINDTVRGAQKQLASNTTNAEDTSSTGALTAFTSDGYSLDSDLSRGSVNNSAYTYVDWAWKANGSAVTNTSGSITSQVSAGTSQGFSVVTWTGTGSTATVGHGLGVAPAMIIMKNRTQGAAGYNWAVYHKSISSASAFVDLNTTAGAATNTGIWNATAPTSTVFSVGTARINNGDLNVAYCFSEVAGFSKFGSYTGNGSTDGPMIFTGFRPRYVMIKRTDSTGSWEMMDTSRDTYNLTGKQLFSDLSNAEFAGGVLDLISNGFKLRDGSTAHNASGGTYIFMAFAESPFRTSLAR